MPLESLMNSTCIQRDNDIIAEASRRSNGRLIPFCTVNPRAGVEAMSEFQRCLDTLDCKGLKLHPWLQGVSLSIPEVDALCELAGQRGVPVLLHDGTPCYSLPSQAALMARRHPNTTIILGHCGIFEHWREALDAMEYAKNLWGCICGSHLAALRGIMAKIDIHRLLWGSDVGFGGNDLIDYRMKLLDVLELSAERRAAILTRNPARLFGLNAESA
jgi:uncharacterized protein